MTNRVDCKVKSFTEMEENMIRNRFRGNVSVPVGNMRSVKLIMILSVENPNSSYLGTLGTHKNDGFLRSSGTFKEVRFERWNWLRDMRGRRKYE